MAKRLVNKLLKEYSNTFTFSIYLQRVTGTGNIDITVDGTTYATQTTTGTWTRFNITTTPYRFNAAMKAGIETLPCWVEEMDDETAYMELVKANNQGELLALEIGIHALATVNNKTKKGGGVRAYAAEIGKGEDALKQWIGGADVYGTLCETSRTNELHNKTSHD